LALNAKQRLFVAEYLIDRNATQAAIRAGYSAKTAKQIGSRLLTVVDIAAAVSTASTAHAAAVGLSVQWVLDRLKENCDRAMQAEPVMIFDPIAKQMVESGEWTYQGNVANKALELIGKQLGMFADKHEHTVTDLPAPERQARVLHLLKAAKDRKTA
jgi:phage terminase small subunit